MPEKIIIGISVENKIAKADKNAVIVCGNSNYKAVFAFDGEWENYKVKTALFATENGDNGTIAVVFEGNECDIPPLTNTTIVGVGVASGDLTQGEEVELATTTPAYIGCLLSIKDLGGVIAPPAPDVYDQIIALLNKYIGQGGGGSGETGGGLTEAEVKEIVQSETEGLQPKVDDGLETESKSVVGAINETNSKALATVESSIADGTYSVKLVFQNDKGEAIAETTLDLPLSEFVKFTDYATNNGNAGVVKPTPSRGISIDSKGLLGTLKATDNEIKQKTNGYKPIVPSSLDYAVKVGITTNTETLTSDEQLNAQKWLGVDDRFAVINTVLEQSGLVSKYKATIEDTYTERVTADGANVLDGSKAKLEKVVGSTVACKQLFDIDNLVYTSGLVTNANGKLIFDNSAISSASYIATETITAIKLNPNTTYTSRCKYKATFVNSGGANGGSMSRALILQKNNTFDSGEKFYIFGDTRVLEKETKEAVIYSTFTTPADLSEYKYLTTRPNAYAITEFSELMLVEGEYTESNFPEYQPYFTGLKSASFAGIESTGRNLVKVCDYTGTHAGVNITVKDNRLSMVGTATGYGVEVWLPLDSVIPKGTYTSNIEGILGTNVNGLYLSPAYRDYANRIVIAATNTSQYTQTVAFDSKYLAIYIATGRTVDCSFDLMLNAGGTALPYKPYIEPTVFNFPETELGEWDRLDLEGQKVVRGTRTITLNGSENWIVAYDRAYSLALTAKTKSGVLNVIHTDVPFDFNASGGSDVSGYSILIARNTQFATVEEYKAYLASNPLTVAYKLYTPTETPFTDEEKASGDKYRADSGGTERVRGNDNAEFGAKNTLSQNYIIVTEVK